VAFGPKLAFLSYSSEISTPVPLNICHILFGHELLIKVHFGDTFSGAPWLTAHLQNLRIPIPKTLDHTFRPQIAN